VFVSGFSFIRNAVKFDYPVKEAIKSVLPLVDEFILALGDSDDDTLLWIESIQDPKIKIINTIWDSHLKEGGRVLAVETNKALKAISKESDWAIYIQGDECLHEADYDTIRKAMQHYKDDQEVEGLLLNYFHFYGTFDFVADSFSRYRREIRIVKPHQGLSSWGDAQGFRIDGRKLKVAHIPATVYHYGMVKHPKHQLEKQLNFNLLWHSEDWVKKRFGHQSDYKYESFDALMHFKGTHPFVMKDRIATQNWEIEGDPTKRKPALKIRIKKWIDTYLGIRIGEYKNYRIVKRFRNNF
jgi:hypothetical protein